MIVKHSCDRSSLRAAAAETPQRPSPPCARRFEAPSGVGLWRDSFRPQPHSGLSVELFSVSRGAIKTASISAASSHSDQVASGSIVGRVVPWPGVQVLDSGSGSGPAQRMGWSNGPTCWRAQAASGRACGGSDRNWHWQNALAA